MPTTKQLFDNWIAEKNMGLSPMDHYGDEHLSAEEASIRRAKTNNAVRKQRENPKGKVVGHYVWDHENNRLKFVPIEE